MRIKKKGKANAGFVRETKYRLATERVLRDEVAALRADVVELAAALRCVANSTAEANVRESCEAALASLAARTMNREAS